MAIAVDASSPVRWAGTATSPSTDTSASFTAPANALLVLCASWDTNTGGPVDLGTPTDSGGLTWTQRVARTGSEATAGGGSGIWTARTTTAAARTVALAYTAAGSGSGTSRKSGRLYVVTGADVDGTPVDTVGAANEGGSSTNNLTTTSITPGAAGLLVAVGTDWNELGLPTSSDLTKDAADYTGAISVLSGYKTVSSGVAVTANLDAAGTAAAQWKWCQVVIRAAAGGAGATAYPAILIPFSGA